MSRRHARLALFALLAAVAAGLLLRGSPPVRVGSKKFTESVVLGEVLRLLARSVGVEAEHRDQIGGTRAPFDALLSGSLDAYVEYTGTLQRDLLEKEDAKTLGEIRTWLGERGVTIGPALGFDNTYALGMTRKRATGLQVHAISDLRLLPDLRPGFSHEFLERGDGWPGVKRHYGLPQADAKGLDHDLAYRALAAGEIDVTDLYATDAKIAMYDLVTLEDDLSYFPEYEAVVLYRTGLQRTHPELVAAFETLGGRISDARMTTLNAAVDVEGRAETAVAADFLREDLGVFVRAETTSRAGRVWKATVEHLELVGASLLVAILLGIALGILAARTGRFGQGIVGVVGAAQTIPGIALLALMVPVVGIGWLPTVIALVVYSLLPIVRNTYTGITNVPTSLTESALVLGLTPRDRLVRVDLPLAMPSIVAGVQTAAVWNVGLAAIGALIAAGGYGKAIMTGIRRADTGLILEGALPAIALALLVQWLFDLVGRWVVSPGLRGRGPS